VSVVIIVANVQTGGSWTPMGRYTGTCRPPARSIIYGEDSDISPRYGCLHAKNLLITSHLGLR